MQSLHPDVTTNADATEYFFLGDGIVQCAVQWSRNEALSPIGLLVSRPERFARKWSTLLFHPEHGLGRTILAVEVNGTRYRPQHASTKVFWNAACDRLHVEWQAGKHVVCEELFCGIAGEIVREVRITDAIEVTIELSLYANFALFDWFGNTASSLFAEGYDRIELATERAEISERTMRVHASAATFRYTIPATMNSRCEQPIVLATTPDASEVIVATVATFNKSAAQLAAVVSVSGRFDASIWQYGFEWSGDAAHVVKALLYCGMFARARAVLQNIFERLSNEEGRVAESSRFRGGDDAELNNNGAVLDAAYTYLAWTGDIEFIRVHYLRITAIAELLLRYADPETGMLIASRDLWERSAAMGVERGFDVAHQSFGILGLHAMAFIADALGNSGARYRTSADKLRESVLHHATKSMIANGRIVKRRLPSGTLQEHVRVEETEANREFLAMFRPKGMPMEAGSLSQWEPDITTVLPIVHRIVDPNSEIGRNTMANIEALWSQAWTGGGYGRYHVAAEPDSPGPWPFATMFVAAAYAEMGEMQHLERALEWLNRKAGVAGTWFEFYGDRPTPPLPPTGIIVWGWAEYIILVVEHILGARVVNGTLTIAPTTSGITGALRFLNERISIA